MRFVSRITVIAQRIDLRASSPRRKCRVTPCDLCSFTHYAFPHRTFAASLAAALRCFAVIVRSRALPPLRPSETAALFFFWAMKSYSKRLAFAAQGLFSMRPSRSTIAPHPFDWHIRPVARDSGGIVGSVFSLHAGHVS